MLKSRIDSDLKAAMLSGDKQRANALKLLKSAILYKEVELGVREAGLEDEQAIDVLTKEAKKRAEAADMYENAGRVEQSEGEKFELAVISEYLPEQLSDDELILVVEAAIAEAGEVTIKDMGRIIGAVKGKVGSSADGGRIAQLVKEKLS